MILPLAAIILLSLAPQTISDRFYSVIDFDQYESVVDAKQRAISQRLLLWKAGFQIFKDHPIVGCGFRCADRVYDQYPEHKIIVKYRHFHSNIIQIAVDMGLLGLFSWMAIWVVYLAKLYRKTRQDWDSEHKWIHLGIAGAFIAFFVSGMFENNFYDSEFMMLMYFLMALPFALPSSQTRSG